MELLARISTSARISALCTPSLYRGLSVISFSFGSVKFLLIFRLSLVGQPELHTSHITCRGLLACLLSLKVLNSCLAPKFIKAQRNRGMEMLSGGRRARRGGHPHYHIYSSSSFHKR
jgi:hypothetical protein